MLTVTSKSFHDKLQVDDDEVILNGPPSMLKGQILLSNDNEEKLSVKELPLQHLTKSNFLGDAKSNPLRISIRLQPNEKKVEQIVHQLNPQTPPGIYESSILAGGKIRKLKMVVQPNVSVNIHPQNFTFQGTSPGTVHKAIITLVNNGNMSFQIPDVKHLSLLDMDYMCRATSLAIRSKGASESYAAMMDELTRNVHKNMTDWITASIKESGEILQPGETKLIELALTLPRNADPQKDYIGDVRFWNHGITYTVKAFDETIAIKKRNGKK